MSSALAGRTDLSQEATDSLLSRHETGVLSLARDHEPYSIPISYGYDRTERRFFIRLVSTPDSDKGRFLQSSPQASLVVYETDDPVYRSVVVKGTLTEIDPDELTTSDVEQYGDAKRPLFEIWDDSLPDLDVTLYRLDPETLSGRRIELDRDA